MFEAKDDYFKTIFQKTAESDSDSDSDDEFGEPSTSSSQPNLDQLDEEEEQKKDQSKFGELPKVEPDSSSIEHGTNLNKSERQQPEYIDIDNDSDSVPSKSNSLPHIPQEIIISDDDDDCIQIEDQPMQNPGEVSATSINSFSVLTTQDFEDYEYNLKLSFLGNIRMFPTKDRTKLSVVLIELINELRQQGKELMVMKDGNRVSLEETPASLELSPATILQAITISLPQGAPVQNTSGVLVKLQDGHRKHTKEFVIELNAPMSELKRKYLESFNLDIETKIRLNFDGEAVDDEATAEELDIDDGCVIDVMFC